MAVGALALALIRAFVIAGPGDPAKVTAMLAEQPALLAAHGATE